MLRLMSAIVLASIAALGAVGGAAAKGPMRIVITGGDLPAPITLDRPIDGREMYGDGVHMEPPVPYPPFVYTLQAYPEGAEATVSPESIYYYPAHDGLPSAFRTRYGFFAVTEEFDAMLAELLPSQEGGGGISHFWYIAPGVALGFVLAGAGLGARAVRRRARARGA